jgi:hypothetical protein
MTASLAMLATEASSTLYFGCPGRWHLAGPDRRDPVHRPEEDRAARMSPVRPRRLT